MMTSLFANLRNKAAIVLCASFTLLALNTHSFAQSPVDQSRYHQKDILSAGHDFFGSISTGLAQVVERAVQQYGEPNGYILGQEGSAAFFAGAAYGEGTLYTRNAGNHPIFWQGPSLGFDVGGDGARVMMLVYDLPSVDAIYRRYVGAKGSAYLVGGFGMQVLSNNDIFVVPVRAGVGARLGLNMGYLKFTRKPTWNPF